MPRLPPSARSLFGVGAGELERGFPGFGAGVAEEDAVEAGDLGEAQGELGGVLGWKKRFEVWSRVLGLSCGDGVGDNGGGRSRERNSRCR